MFDLSIRKEQPVRSGLTYNPELEAYIGSPHNAVVRYNAANALNTGNAPPPSAAVNAKEKFV